MNGKQRIAAAMRHASVDRVPVMCQLAIGHYLLNTAISPVDLWFTSEGFAQAAIELQRRYRFDGILINLPGRDPDWRRHVERIETAADGGQTVHFRNGDVADCPADDNVQHTRAKENRSPSIDDVDLAEVFYDDPHCLGGLKYPFYFGLDPYRPDRGNEGPRYWPEYWFRTIDLVLEEVGDEVSVHSEVFSPFTQLMELFGYQQALMYLLDEPEKCRALLAAYAKGASALAVEQVRHGVDAVLISSAFAGAGFISPKQYEQFVLPFEAEVVDAIKRHVGLSRDIPVYTHTCGEIGDRLELMAETGIDGIDTLDPPPLGSVDLEDAKRRIGDRLFFKGNVDSVNTLLAKSPEEVRRDARWRLEVGSPGGGYILSSACSVSPAVRPENLLALVEASRAFGTPVE